MELILKFKPVIILVLVPIAFTIIIGASMSPIFVDDIPIAILDLDNSPESRDIVSDFEVCQTFRIVEAAVSDDQMKDDILTGKIEGGLVLPAGFGKAVTERAGAKALMLIDESNTLIGNNLKLYAYKIFSDRNFRLQISDLEYRGALPYSSDQYMTTLSSTSRILYNPQQGYLYYLYAGLLGIFIQQTYFSVMVPLLLKEKERLKMEPLDRTSRRIQVRKMMPLILQYAGYTFISSLSCLMIAHGLFAYPIKGSLLLTMLFQVIFLAGLTGVSLIFAAIFDDVTHSAQFIMFLTIPSMLSCGYSWPEFMMAPHFAAIMKLIWPLYYYYNPLKELMLKGAEFSAIQNYFFGGILFAVFWLPAGLWIYRQKIRTMKQIDDIERG
jgi:ABC-2 type transport system permease protein